VTAVHRVTKRDSSVEQAETLEEFVASAAMPMDSRRPSHSWWLPSAVELTGSDTVLVYRYGRGSREIGPGAMTGLLAAFVRLTTATPEHIRRFAAGRAALNFDERGIPSESGPTRVPVACYKEYAQVAAAVLRTASRVHHGQDVHPDDDPIFTRFLNRGLSAASAVGARPETIAGRGEFLRLLLGNFQGVSLAREIVAATVNWWNAVGNVRPAVWWDRETLQVGSRGGGWGAIGAQLMTAVAGELAEPRCGYCDRVIKGRSRRPKANQIPCCGRDDCRRTADTIRKRRQRST